MRYLFDTKARCILSYQDSSTLSNRLPQNERITPRREIDGILGVDKAHRVWYTVGVVKRKYRRKKVKITFGKWQGWDTDELAKSGSFGRPYLEWGAEELKSPKWRKEFQRALSDNQVMDKNAIAKAIRQDYPDLVAELDQAIEIELGEWGQLQEVEEAKQKLTNFFSRKLRELGVAEGGVIYLQSNFYQIEELFDRGKVKFAQADVAKVIDLCERYSQKMYEVEMA